MLYRNKRAIYSLNPVLVVDLATEFTIICLSINSCQILWLCTEVKKFRRME